MAERSGAPNAPDQLPASQEPRRAHGRPALENRHAGGG